MVLKVHLTVPGLETSRTLHYVLSRLSYPTLCNPMDCSLPGSPVHGILQARILERAACPSPGDLSDLGIKPTSPPAPALQAYSLLLSHWGSPVPGGVRSKLPLISASPCVCQASCGFFFKFYFIFKLYIIVLVFPNIKMNPPQVYMCSPS